MTTAQRRARLDWLEKIELGLHQTAAQNEPPVLLMPMALRQQGRPNAQQQPEPAQQRA